MISVSGVRYYGYRHYSPELGRCISRDPLGEKGFRKILRHLYRGAKEPNPYIFVLNRPIAAFDVLGLSFWDWLFGKTCGPDFTMALHKELERFDDYMAGMPEWPTGAVIGPPITDINLDGLKVLIHFAHLALAPDYASQDLRSPNCPKGRRCKNTLTLCGMCVEKDVPGNIMFGYMAAVYGIPEGIRNLGADIAEFFDLDTELWEPPSDLGTFEVGELIAERSGGGVCNAVRTKLPDAKKKKECCLCDEQILFYDDADWPPYPDWGGGGPDYGDPMDPIY